MSLTRESILEAKDLQTQSIQVPEWGGEVLVKTMTGKERDAFEMEAYTVKGKSVEANRENFRARILLHTLADAEGKRLFSAEDLEALGSKSGKVLDRLFGIAMKLNGLSQTDMEELTKN